MQQRVGVGDTEELGDRVLLLEGELVGTATGHAMERDPSVEEQVAVELQLRHVTGPQVPLRHEDRGAAAPAIAVGHRHAARRGNLGSGSRRERPPDPTGRMHVAQPARAVLEVRSEHLGDRARREEAIARGRGERLDEPRPATRRELAHLVDELAGERRVAREQPHVEQRGERVGLVVRQCERLLHRAHRVTEHEAGVPHRIPEL